MFDCTVFGMLRVHQHPPFPGLPAVSELVGRRLELGRELLDYHDTFLQTLSYVQTMGLVAGDIRVPLDVVRSTGNSPRWCPLAVSACPVTSQVGLIRMLGWCEEISQHAALPLPLCVDENIHYRLLKLAYGQKTHRYDFRGVLARCPPLYGVWHAYKYVVTLVHRVFFSQFVFLANGEVAPGRTFPSKLRLRTVEMMIATLMGHRDAVLPELKRAIVQLAVDHRGRGAGVSTASRLRNLMAMERLLEVYVPVAFMLGWQARCCVWDNRRPGSGERAKQLLMGCLYALLALTEGDSQHCEYVRTCMCCLLCWTRWHSAVPGACYTDESNEASLGQLGRWWRQHTEVADEETLMNLYLMVPGAGRPAADMVVGRPSVALRRGVLARLQALLRSNRELCTYVPWEPTGAARLCRAAAVWPPNAWFPADLQQAPGPQYLQRLMRYFLALLVTQPRLRAEVHDAARAIGLVERGDAGVLAEGRAIQTLLQDMPAELRTPVVRAAAAAPVEEEERRGEGL